MWRNPDLSPWRTHLSFLLLAVSCSVKSFLLVSQDGLHGHTVCLSSTCHKQPSCKFELGTLVYFCRMDQGCSFLGSGFWIPKVDHKRHRVHSGMLLGPEDFISNEEGPLKKAEKGSGKRSPLALV